MNKFLLKNKNSNSKKAFSLAEAMVLFVIIAVIMALSVPFLSKKSQTDTKSLWYLKGSNIQGAMGKFQRVGIGTATPEAKLHIKSNSTTGTDEIFKVSSNVSGATPFVVKADGSTNIRTCAPDYAATSSDVTSSSKMSSDGFIYCNKCSVTINDIVFGNDNVASAMLVPVAKDTEVTTVTNDEDDGVAKFIPCKSQSTVPPAEE